jgi:hypothetical protein
MTAELNERLVETFQRDGVVVIPNIISSEEVAIARTGLHSMLLQYGCDVNDLTNTAQALDKLSSTHGSGGVLDTFYFDWKLKLNENLHIFDAISSLWSATYASYDSFGDDATYLHPYGAFHPDQGYMYIDRVCYRLPSHLAVLHGKCAKNPLQRSLTPHLDCCPTDLYSGHKWRPIQCFLALTDTMGTEEGGFEACLGMHRGFEQWVKTRQCNSKDGSPAPCVGQFTPIRPQEDCDIISRMQHIPCRYSSKIAI